MKYIYVCVCGKISNVNSQQRESLETCIKSSSMQREGTMTKKQKVFSGWGANPFYILDLEGVGMVSKMFSINRERSRPEGKANWEWMHQKCLRLDYNKPSGKCWMLGHIDCKISSNMKCIALNASKAKTKIWGKYGRQVKPEKDGGKIHCKGGGRVA